MMKGALFIVASAGNRIALSRGEFPLKRFPRGGGGASKRDTLSSPARSIALVDIRRRKATIFQMTSNFAYYRNEPEENKNPDIPG